jgi:hypothetical protein
MPRYWPLILSCLILSLCLGTARAQNQPTTAEPLHVSYETYAAGIHVADVESGFSFGPQTYKMKLGYRTTGMVGFFLHGHQFDIVDGAWRGMQAEPSRFIGQGSWRGVDRLTAIDYHDGNPVVRQLVPPNTTEQEPVPEAMQANTIDSLSGLAQLIRIVRSTGRCETAVRTYDGRRTVEIEAHTAGEEMLEPTDRSSFAGKALRCDFSGRVLAGFRLDDDRARQSKPMHGSAWLAPVTGVGPPLPVRITFQTRWFGDATMYLTGIAPGFDRTVAGGN